MPSDAAASGAVGEAFQTVPAPGPRERCEGIAFSPSGHVVAVASPDTNKVFLFRRRASGLLEDTPYWTIQGPESRLNYPHDVAFSRAGETEVLAVAQRRDAIALFARNAVDDTYGPAPAFEIRGRESRLSFSDGVAFVPPHEDYLAACNLDRDCVSFYRRHARAPLGFRLRPAFELRHKSLVDPDGLAFSPCGRWLAVANHGGHSVCIFERRPRILTLGRLRYGPAPVTVLADPGLRHPHSVAFTESNHLVVTNAGANYFSVYEPRPDGSGLRWSAAPVLQRIVGADALFRAVNARNKMEGGPKGIAIFGDTLAICSPEHGVKMFPLHQGRPAR